LVISTSPDVPSHIASLVAAEALRFPVVGNDDCRMAGGVEDEDDGPASFFPRGSEAHGSTFGNDDVDTWFADDFALWSFEAGFAGFGIEGLGARVAVGSSDGAGSQDGLHVLSGVTLAILDGERSDLGDALSAGWWTGFLIDSEEPDLTESFDNSGAGAFGGFRRGAGGIEVERPEDGLFGKFAERLGLDNPATGFAGRSLRGLQLMKPVWAWRAVAAISSAHGMAASAAGIRKIRLGRLIFIAFS
jgi:hypothetical protein